MNEQATAFNLFDYFLNSARLEAIGGRAALRFRGRNFSYAELRAMVESWAARLDEAAIGAGERVALLLYDSPEFIAAFLATLARAAIAVPINTYLTKEEVRFILADSRARLTIAEAELAQRYELEEDDKQRLICVDDQNRPSLVAAPPNRRAGVAATTTSTTPSTTSATPAFLLYTSGSTGTPKGALHLHGNARHTVESFGRSVLRLTPSDRVFSASRLFFAYGLGNSLSFPLAAGATVILESERPTPERLAALFASEQPTVFYAVPSVYQGLLGYHQSGAALPVESLRLCISAGEALPAAVFEAWRRQFDMEILDGIGSTEMLHMFISNRQGRARAASSGTVVEGYAAKLVDDAGEEIVGDGAGNLLIKGDSRMQGYWGRDDLTAEVLRDGWMRTGDVYRRETAGEGGEDYYFHIGRSDDCFKVKGMWVSPVEVESALLGHAAVNEAAVVCGSDENGLATVKAFVVIRTESEAEKLEEELLEFSRAQLPSYKAPSSIEFIQEMPRTSTGKIQRFRLRG